MKKTITKIINYGYKFILIFTIICLSISLVGATFFYFNRNFIFFNPIVLIIGSIIYLLLLAKIYNFIEKLTEDKKKIIAIVLLMLQFCLLLISSFMIRSIPQVDLIHILTEINSLNNTGTILNNTYFSVYPNNRFILILLYSIQRISPNNKELLFTLLSVLSITTMTLFTYKTSKKVFGINKGLLSLFILVFSPIFYLYVSYYYTDILMLPFASILLYLIIKTKDENTLKVNTIYGILIGLIAIISYKIRAVAIFLLIAYFVYAIICQKTLLIIKKFVPIAIGMFLALTCINNIENNFFTNIDSNKEFPMTHWIMMGLNEEHYGYYSQDDYNLSSSVKNVDDRINLNIQEIKRRLNTLGPVGITKLAITKLVSVWGKGDYSYQKYLDLVSDYNTSYQYLLEDKNIVINYLLQFSKISILILTILALIKLFKTKVKSIIAISIFGAIVFYLIWEVCPRYGLSFLPWLILLSCYSYDNLNHNFSELKLFKYLKYTLIIVTIIMFVGGFNKYTNISTKSSIVAKDTVKKIKYIELNRENNIIQSLKLNSEFNEIKLKFKVMDNNQDASYKLELLDEKKKSKFIEEFNKDNIVSDDYTVFNLNKSYPKGTYYISLSANSNSSIKVYSAYKKEFDYYPNGNLELNGQKEVGDLMFEVTNNCQRSVYSYVEYIVIFILCITTEYFVLLKKD